MKTFFVTGSSRGFGKEIVIAALEAGHNVVASARNPGEIKTLESCYERLLTVQMDVTSQEQVSTAVIGRALGSTALGQFRYAADKYGFEATQLNVGSRFDAQVGFVPRRGFDRRFLSGRYSPRPAGWRGVRKIGWEGSLEFVDELKRFTRERLSQHEFPRHIAFVSELPKTPAGKINRKTLRDREGARHA